MSAKNPGSFNGWVESHPDQNHDEQIMSYGVAVADFRLGIAEDQGSSPEDIHSMHSDVVHLAGQLSLLTELEGE